MALRIDLAITHGEIDNTERGLVRARFWLLGSLEPVELELEGDAWRDVAGTKVTFVNPSPQPQSAASQLELRQTGVVGDITVSRKVKVFSVPEDEWKQAYLERRIDDVPTEWCNSLYLEWFSARQGRCVVESADYEISISEHVWELDEDEEAAQKMANMQAMRDFLAGVIQRPEEKDEASGETAGDDEGPLELTEAEWEAQLQASDRLSDASMEAYEKYGEDEDAEEKTAFVMGWDHLLGDMADAQEGVEPSDDDSLDKKRRREWADLMNQAAAEEEEDEAWRQDDSEDSDEEESGEGSEDREEGEPHPLVKTSRDFLLKVIRELRASDLNIGGSDDENHPLDRFMTNLMQMSGKLAGALHGARDLEDPLFRGYVLAVTKRCLNWAAGALSALAEVRESGGHNASQRALLDSWATGVQSLREEVIRIREELGGE